MVDWDLLKKLIKVIKDEEITGLAVEEDGVKYEVKAENGKVMASQPVPVAAPTPVAAVPSPVAEEDNDDSLVAITSPMVGTFYRAPSPGAAPFVKIGDSVDANKVVCIIEAMKLFNEIEAEVNGKVEKILVEDGQPVEYGQKLMLIKKA